jgi:hypothetical protein
MIALTGDVSGLTFQAKEQQNKRGGAR